MAFVNSRRERLLKQLEPQLKQNKAAENAAKVNKRASYQTNIAGLQKSLD